MCGLVGAFSFGDSSFRVTEPYIARMRDVMQHRGPDGAGGGTVVSPSSICPRQRINPCATPTGRCG
jgi:asparagine synthetase B (glutamine-hydrolysing)